MTVPARTIRYGAPRHRHADEYTPRDLAAWLACPGCQHGHPVLVTGPVATAIHTIITAVAPGIAPAGGRQPLEGGETA